MKKNDLNTRVIPVKCLSGVLLLFATVLSAGCESSDSTPVQSEKSARQTETKPVAGKSARHEPILPELVAETEAVAQAETPVVLAASSENVGGTIEGVVIYKADPKRKWRYSRYYIKDRKKGYLAEATVAIRGTQLKKMAPASKPKTVLVDQKEIRFVPETVAIRAGDSLKFTNSDGVIHNVYSTHPLAKFDDSIKTGESFTQLFRRAAGIHRPIVLGCRFHSQMACTVFVFDHPWFQMTGETGRFRLENVPPGAYQLEMAHSEGKLEWSRKVEVRENQTLNIEIHVSPDDKKF